MKVIAKSSTKRVEKTIVREGIFSVKRPTERSSCRIKLDTIKFSESSIDAETLRSEYLNHDFGKDGIIIGDASSEVDECIERIIETMFISEKSLARITLDNNNERSCSIDFEITLIECEFFKPIWEWSMEEKYEIALRYKQLGVSLHKSMRIVEAFKKFSRACKILITLEPLADLEVEGPLKNDIENLRKVLYNNMAECHLIRKNYEYAASLCDKVLLRDENNVKAIYRRAIAQENLKDYEKALEHMEKVISLEPRNSSAKEKATLYKQRVEQAKKNYNNIVKRMFNA